MSNEERLRRWEGRLDAYSRLLRLLQAERQQDADHSTFYDEILEDQVHKLEQAVRTCQSWVNSLSKELGR